MFEKIFVNGEATTPLYKYLKSQAKGFLIKEIKWNFIKVYILKREKLLIDLKQNMNHKKIT